MNVYAFEDLHFFLRWVVKLNVLDFKDSLAPFLGDSLSSKTLEGRLVVDNLDHLVGGSKDREYVITDPSHNENIVRDQLQKEQVCRKFSYRDNALPELTGAEVYHKYHLPVE